MFSMVLVMLLSVAISGGWLGSGRLADGIDFLTEVVVGFFAGAFFAGAFFAVGFCRPADGLVVAFLATGFFFAVAMIYSPLAVVTAKLFLATYCRCA